jgi:hypothetical protein
MTNQFLCDSCGNPIKVQTKCACHDCTKGANDATIGQAILFAAASLFLLLFGGCWVTSYYETEQVKAVKAEKDLHQNNPSLPGQMPFKVIPKEVLKEPPKPEEKK